MRILKRILIIVLFVAAGIALLVYLFVQIQKPKYSGTVKLDNQLAPVTVYFDNFGIPHIYGENATDTYRVLGYTHAAERGFQMELIRRVSSGRLAEIFGNGLTETDAFFRMLGFAKRAEQAEREFYLDTNAEYKKQALAYLDGINQYLHKGPTRLEFKLVGIPKEDYRIRDLFLIADYLSFNFQMGFRTDPVLTGIYKRLGNDYVKDLGVFQFTSNDTTAISLDSTEKVTASIDKIVGSLPVPIWTGSNSWIAGPQLSKSGKCLFENDTHIGIQQPAVWYESYIEYPGFKFYGNYIAGFPFAPIGHTPHHVWGLTMLENDDLDFFTEKINPDDTNSYYHIDEWKKMSLVTETIKVKDSASVTIKIRSTVHGPVCSDVMKDIRKISDAPVSACWTYLQKPCNLMEITYRLAHANTMDEFKMGVSLITAPGLNVTYADNQNNYSLYTAASFVKRKPEMNPFLFSSGTGEMDWDGYYDFTENPRQENPVNGYLFSANNHPDPARYKMFAGYYLPVDRSIRIQQLLRTKKSYSMDDFEKMTMDNVNPSADKISHLLLDRTIPSYSLKSLLNERAFSILSLWSGEHPLEAVAPVIYYRWLYNVLHNAMADEIDEETFAALLKTHNLKSSIDSLLSNENSPWWDNVKTKTKETEKEIVSEAFDQTINQLITQLGKEPDEWKWKLVHQIEYIHPLGKQKPLDKVYNIGPYPAPGGMETVNNQSFVWDSTGVLTVNLGPALRRIVDMAQPLEGISINPSGQSGNIASRYYNDQVRGYIGGRFRKELMKKEEVISKSKNQLDFQHTK